MDKRSRLQEAIKGVVPDAPQQVFKGIVKSIQGLTCTVDLMNTDLTDVEGVNLRADEDAKDGLLLVPQVGSLVYVAVVENSVDNLFVCYVSEVDRLEVVMDKLTVVVDKKDGIKATNDKVSLELTTSAATMKQDATTIELKGGKASIKNGVTSLKTLFDDLTSLLQTFQVTCAAPGSPSAPFPASVTQVTTLKAKVATLLS